MNGAPSIPLYIFMISSPPQKIVKPMQDNRSEVRDVDNTEKPVVRKYEVFLFNTDT